MLKNLFSTQINWMKTSSVSDTCMSLEAGLYTLVESPEDFLNVISHLQKFNLLAVDFEGEWNLHRYGLHLCLIQISDGEKTFIVDPLCLDDFGRSPAS